ncbi:MAG: hypothetical protein ACTH31_08975 [Pseudoclavibacter sp.]
MAEPHSYRVTRASFDLMSVYGCAAATALPGPAIAALLEPRGYSPSSVRNRLVQAVDRGHLLREVHGRVSVYRRHPRSDTTFEMLAGDAPTPEWTGSFPAILITIPESRRSERDRVLYAARFYLGYRQLRSGVLIGFADAYDQLGAYLAGEAGRPDAAGTDGESGPVATSLDGIEPCTLTPRDEGQAREWVRRAFEVTAFEADMTRLEARVDAFANNDAVTESQYFDAFFDVSQLAFRVPIVPAALLAPGAVPPGARVGRALEALVRFWGERFAEAALARVMSLPSAGLIEWDAEHLRRIGKTEAPLG